MRKEQNSSDVATAKLQRTSGYLTHPPGHCGLELLPLSPDSSRQRLLQEDLNMPLAAESLVGEDSYWYILAQLCGRSCHYRVEDLLETTAAEPSHRCWSSGLCCCVDGLSSVSKSPLAALN